MYSFAYGLLSTSSKQEALHFYDLSLTDHNQKRSAYKDLYNQIGLIGII